MDKISLPKATLGRLPQYLQYLKELPSDTCKTVSASSIAKGLSLGDVQVRKDLSAVSGEGRPKIGYITSELIERLEECLGCNQFTPAVLVGAGKLGKALLEYDGFEEYGIRIVAGFDRNEQTLQLKGSSKSIFPIGKLESFCREQNVKLGIITVGQSSAQEVCDMMLDCGITAIWNFAPCRLKLPDGILQRQENLALSLAYLNNQLRK